MSDQHIDSGVRLDHTVVNASDRTVSATFLAGILGLKVGAPTGPFVPVVVDGGLTLDFYTYTGGPVQSQHYAFRVPAAEFDTMIDRLERSGVTYYADPRHTRPAAVGEHGGWRNAYFADPDGHNMEIMTYPSET
ncbi:VOC family protein [Actinocorallia aurea]